MDSSEKSPTPSHQERVSEKVGPWNAGKTPRAHQAVYILMSLLAIVGVALAALDSEYLNWVGGVMLWLGLGTAAYGIAITPYAIWIYRRASREQTRLLEQRCLGCGYDLRASSDRCPECGRPRSLTVPHPRPRNSPLKMPVVILFSLVVTIIAMQVSLVTVGFAVSADRAKLNATRASIAMIRQSLEQFHTDFHRYPTTAEGLDALAHPPAGLPPGKSPYTEKLPTDAWGHEFIYRFPSSGTPATYDLHSAGPDGVDGTADDIHSE